MIEFNATFLVAMLSFVLFILIMNAIFYRPILNIIRKRENYIASNTESAQKFEQKAEELTKEHKDNIEKKQAQCRTKFKESLSKEQTKSGEKIKEAREASKNEILKQKDILIEEEKNLRTELKITVVSALASDITQKVTKGVLK